MGSRPKGIVLICLIGMVLAACVKPVDPTPTPRPTDIPPLPTPTQPVILGPTFPPETITAWVQTTFGITPTGLIPFMQLQIGPDDVVGYTYQDASGQQCAGVILTTASTGQIWNGHTRCVPAGTGIIAVPALLALTNGEPYIATYIYVDPGILPGASAVAIQFPDGSSLPTNNQDSLLRNNGYVGMKAGFDFPSLVIITDQGGNILSQVSPQ
ncbi:MAG: hypothetical protein K8I82_22340 [Anaerolineae bacterium]|nr:hypothetical protein [Anaerolineae bacterium]